MNSKKNKDHGLVIAQTACACVMCAQTHTCTIYNYPQEVRGYVLNVLLNIFIHKFPAAFHSYVRLDYMYIILQETCINCISF